MKREDQQDATIRCLLLTSVSTCFGHHYAHLQENKGPVTAFGMSFCNKRENADISRDVFFCVVNLVGKFVCLRMSCVNGCVVASDWYLPRTLFGSGVSGTGVLMHALCLFGGRRTQKY